MTKKQKKVPITDYLEKHKYSLIEFVAVSSVIKTNLNLDELVIILQKTHEDDLESLQVIDQTTGQIYVIENEIKLVPIENIETWQAN